MDCIHGYIIYHDCCIIVKVFVQHNKFNQETEERERSIKYNKFFSSNLDVNILLKPTLSFGVAPL